MFKTLIAAVVMAILTSTAMADTKIGFVNTERILKDAPMAQRSKAKLEKEFGAREKELVTLSQSFQTAQSAYEKEAPTLSESMKRDRERKLSDLNRDLQRKQREFSEDLNARRSEELQQIMERANRVIRQIAEAEKYDIIFQEAVHADKRIDITDKVLKALDSAK